MSSFLASALRHLFPPKLLADTKAAATETSRMDYEPQQASAEAIDPSALSAAVDMHEAVNALERSTYEARLHDAMDDLLKRLDTKRNG